MRTWSFYRLFFLFFFVFYLNLLDSNVASSNESIRSIFVTWYGLKSKPFWIISSFIYLFFWTIPVLYLIFVPLFFFSSSKLINQVTLFILYFIQIYRVVNLSWFTLQRHNYFISSFFLFFFPPLPFFFTIIKQPSTVNLRPSETLSIPNLFLRSFLLSSTSLITTSYDLWKFWKIDIYLRTLMFLHPIDEDELKAACSHFPSEIKVGDGSAFVFATIERYSKRISIP